MDEKAVPYIVFEGSMARMERVTKRLWIVVIILIALLFGTNAGWIWYESQFVSESVSVEQEVDTGEGDAFVSGTGDIRYGEGSAESYNDKTD